jgi:hypothetical protein
MLNKIAGKRWFNIGLLTLSAALLILVSLQLGHQLPPLPALKRSTEAALEPVDQIEQLSSKTAFFRVKPFTNGKHPFFTLNFQPPPAPIPTPVVEPPKPPPPPPTKKLAVLYQGLYQTGAGEKRAFLQVEGKLSVVATGAPVAGYWTIKDIQLKNLILTNQSAQTNTLQFNHPSEIEVPAK